MCGVVTTAARRMQEAMCRTPALAALAEAGWDAEQDEEVQR
jgi:hypothetical protein